jgi:hypothetical protein
MVAPIVGAGLGSTDCERLGDGFLAQPVNAVTSLAYVVVAVVIVASGRRRGAPGATTLVPAALLAAIGIGSLAFHGPQPTGSQLLHDLPILLLAVFVAVSVGARIVGEVGDRAPLASPLPAFAGAAVPAVLVSVGDVGTAGASAAIVASAALGEVFLARRDGRPDPVRRRLAAVGVLAVGAYVLGRTGSPACSPDSLLQLHGAWHLLTAVAAGLWWTLTGPRGAGDRGSYR